MHFDNPEKSVSPDDISAIEAQLKITFPDDLKNLYLASNGGCPENYVYTNADIDTVVSEFLPIQSSTEGFSAVDSYKHLVLNKKIVPLSFFPFAVDGGGDYFFIDCSTLNGDIYFYRSDSSQAPLIPLSLGISEFWLSLQPE